MSLTPGDGQHQQNARLSNQKGAPGQHLTPVQKMKEEQKKLSSYLSLENSKLQDLNFMGGIVWDNLSQIDLHKNYLSSIDILNSFRNLKQINASDNYIQEINLNLLKLEDLDLHNNYINKFPLLHQLPKITNLNLNSNKISDLRVDFKPPSSLSLLHLDLGQNVIEYDFMEFQEIMEKFKKLKNLKSFVLLNNKIKDDKINDYIISQLTSLESFNYERAENIRKQIFEAGRGGDQATAGGKTKDGKSKRTKGQKGDKKYDYFHYLTLYSIFQFPTLEQLCFNLEAANSHPSYALDHLKELAVNIDKIISHSEMIEEYFAKKKTEAEIVKVDFYISIQNEMIETFMQNSQLLIDNHYELQSIMLSILSKLSIIKFHDFGVRCFNTLKDLMIAGKEMEQQVMEILKKEVINKLQQTNPELISISLLQGLHELVDETEKPDMLTGLFENAFPAWLKLLVEKVNASKRIAMPFEDNIHFDQIIALLSVAVKDNKVNVNKAIQKELLPLISTIVNESTLEQSRYINCLRIVEYISYQQSEGADIFINRSVHININKNIRNSMYIYKKNYDLKDEDQKDTEEKIKRKYLTLAAEIDCLGGLLEADKSKRDVIIKESTIDDLLSVSSHQRTDPVLLTAICKFAKQLFSREEIKLNQHIIEPKVKKMQNLVQLVPYLGLKKYEELLKMSRRYYDQGIFADKEQVIQLQHLDDLIVHKLFIAIINLMSFFCEEAEKSSSVPIFHEVSMSLNKSERETALFNCLDVPNDDVKLAVVECLNHVPLSEFDTEEIATILRLLGSQKNIGAGKTEFVLSMIFWILIKLTNDKDPDSSGKNFRVKFGEKAITECIDILTRNLQRLVDDEDEEQEKLALSLSCLHFLKFTSVNHDLKRYLLNRHESFKQALYADENNTTTFFFRYPIEIEMTWLGRNIDVLIHSMTGTESIIPYNYVSFRIIQRIADILMNKFDDYIVDPFKEDVDVIETLKDYYNQLFKKRKKTERTYWVDMSNNFFKNLEKNSDAYHLFSLQHHQFTSNNGIPLLKMFLIKKVPNYEQILKKEFDPNLEKAKNKLKEKVLEHKVEVEQKERQKASEKDENKKSQKKQRKKHDKNDDDEGGLNVLRMTLQQEDIGQHYSSTLAEKQLQSSTQKNIESIKKRDYKVGVQNMKLRCLCIAAYLRCLYAAIEYATTQELKNEAIRNLSDEFTFKSITQLCDTTGWIEANIGAKYLRVIRHIIKVPFFEASESMDRLQIYDISCFSIRKMLNIIHIKLMNDQQTPLTDEDKILIYELAATCSLILNQITLFSWSSTVVKQQGSHMKTRRTPQQKLIDFQTAQLFPPQSIFTFIQIIFRDMTKAYQLFDVNFEANPDDAENEYIKRKNNMARVQIKVFLGEYLSKCKDKKYDILEKFMKGVVFEQKKLRESFLQEILKSMEDAAYRVALEGYMQEQKIGFDSEKERINWIDWVDVSIDGSSTFKPRLLVFTHKGMHLLKSSSSKMCGQCPAESFCPSGPRPDLKIPYEQIAEIVTFGQVFQKIVINVSSSSKKDSYISYSLILPKTQEAFQLNQFAKEIVHNYKSERIDALTKGSILMTIGVQEKINYVRYISLKQTKIGQGGSWGDSSAIFENGYLLVIAGENIILFKENWSKWYLTEDMEKILRVLKQKPQTKGKVISIAEKQEQEQIKEALKNYMKEYKRISIDSIDNLHVHKGKDSNVDLVFGEQLTIYFQCDYSRQQFVEILMDIKTGRMVEEKEEDEGANDSNQEGDDEEEEEEGEEVQGNTDK